MKLTLAQARCLASLEKHGPMTKAELAIKSYIALSTLKKCVTLEPLEKEGLVHRCLLLNKSGVPEYVWAAGKEDSVSDKKMESLKKRYIKRFQEK